MSNGSQHQTDQFDRDTIESLLTALNDKLAEADLYGDIYVIGGAALILEYGADRRTGDIDCAIHREPEAIHTAAAEIANEWPQLPADWLNETAVAHKIPDEPDDAATISFKGSHLTVRTASPERLIAMKIHAGREGDYKDLERLFGITAIKSGYEAKTLTEYHFPHKTIADDIVKRLDTIIESATRTETNAGNIIQAKTGQIKEDTTAKLQERGGTLRPGASSEETVVIRGKGRPADGGTPTKQDRGTPTRTGRG